MMTHPPFLKLSTFTCKCGVIFTSLSRRAKYCDACRSARSHKGGANPQARRTGGEDLTARHAPEIQHVAAFRSIDVSAIAQAIHNSEEGRTLGGIERILRRELKFDEVLEGI